MNNLIIEHNMKVIHTYTASYISNFYNFFLRDYEKNELLTKIIYIS